MNNEGKSENIKFNSIMSRIQMFEKNTSTTNNNIKKEPIKVKKDEPKNEENKIEQKSIIEKPKIEEVKVEKPQIEEEKVEKQIEEKKSDELKTEEKKTNIPKLQHLNSIQQKIEQLKMQQSKSNQQKLEPMKFPQRKFEQNKIDQIKLIESKIDLSKKLENYEQPKIDEIKNEEKKEEKNEEKKEEKIEEKNEEKKEEKNEEKKEEKKEEKIEEIKKEKNEEKKEEIKKEEIKKEEQKQNFLSQSQKIKESKPLEKQQSISLPQNKPQDSNLLYSKTLTPQSIQKVSNPQQIINNTKDIFLTPIEIPEEVKNESFCEGFFIASFPKENGKIEENSDSYKSDCGHKDCSSLPAMQPEIVYRYPEKDTKDLEINNLAASICFPNGIKICYEEDVNPITVKNYYSSITNQTGDRFYIVTYHFYIRMMNSNFVQQYKIHPIRFQTMKFCNEYYESIETDQKLQEEIQIKLDKYSELNFREIVNIPFCFCLISRYPFFNQMEKCLESIKSLFSNYNSNGDDLHNLIKYLVKEIPFPKTHIKIEFPIPYIPDMNKLINPYLEDLILIGPNPSCLFNYFSVDNIILIFRLIIFEQKILFVDSELQRLGEVTNAFISMIYPFQWIHTFIPIMSAQMLKYLQAFLPFINGIHVNLYEYAKDILDEAEEGVYIVHISNNTIDINWDKSSKKVKIIKKINENIPNLPKHIEKELYNQLNNIKTIYEKGKKDIKYKKNTNILIYNLIIQIFVEIFYDYRNYLTVIEDYPLFNTNSLLNARPKADEKFYKEITETQIFQLFIQNAIKRTNNNYFIERIKLYLELKEKERYINEKMTNEFIKSCAKMKEIEKTYSIKPYFLKSKEQYSTIEELEKILKSTYSINPEYCNKKGITKEDKRLIGQIINLEYTNKTNSYNYYHIPNTPVNVSGASQGKSKITAKASIFEKRELLNIAKKNSCIRINGKKPEWTLTENEKDDIKDNIKDILSRVLKCEEINENEDKKQLISCIESSFGRNFFIDILYQKNISEKTEKAINKGSFELLTTVIYNAILSILKLDENQENISSVILLIKSSQLYYLDDKKEKLLLIDSLYPKLKGINLLTKMIFWEEWYNISIKEETSFKRNDPSNEEIILKILEHIVNVMLKSKIQKDIIFNNATTLSNKIKNENILTQFKKILTLLLKNN